MEREIILQCRGLCRFTEGTDKPKDEACSAHGNVCSAEGRQIARNNLSNTSKNRQISVEHLVDAHLTAILEVLVKLIQQYLEGNSTLYFNLGWF